MMRTRNGTMRTNDWMRQHDVHAKRPLDEPMQPVVKMIRPIVVGHRTR
jgi:hypothetical protein